jgi:hypothetical protein
MKKVGLALLAALTVSVATANVAEARGFGPVLHAGGFAGGFHGGGSGFRGGSIGHDGHGWGGWGGFGAGLLAGSAMGPYDAYAYDDPYFYSYPYDYGYPAYGYFTGPYPPYGRYRYSVPARRVVHAHGVHRQALSHHDRARSAHARFLPARRAGAVHAG